MDKIYVHLDQEGGHIPDATIFGSIRFNSLDAIAFGIAKGIFFTRAYYKVVVSANPVPVLWAQYALTFPSPQAGDTLPYQLYLN